MFQKLKSLFRPPVADLVFCKGEVVYFRLKERPKLGKGNKANFTCKLPEGQEFGAIIQVLTYEEDKGMYTGKLEHPLEAMQYVSKLLGLPFEDRRITPRLDRNIKVLSPQLPGYSAMSRNLSETGICLVTTQIYPAGTLLSLEMDLDAAGILPLRVQVEARWAAHDACGAGQHLIGGRFLGLTNAQRSQLRTYIASLIKPFEHGRRDK